MTTRTYIVALHEGVDYDQFWLDMERSSNVTHVPNRPVDIVNNRSRFRRICEYALTDHEADQLRSDPRVAGVEIPVRDNPNVQVLPTTIFNPSTIGMNFNVQAVGPPNLSAPFDASINWGLIRHSYPSNRFTNNPQGLGATTTDYLNYVLDGTGVDVVINDSGMQVNHPEFTDANGITRVPFVNWNSFRPPGCTTDFNALSYQDTDGHGTHTAGVAAGKTYGWAKNARVIPLYYAISGQSAADPLDMFEILIDWHASKGPNGRPTVLNMSYGFFRIFPSAGTSYYVSITGGKYRDESPWTGPKTTEFYQSRGLIPLGGSGVNVQPSQAGILPYDAPAYNAAMAEVIDAGIIVIKSAGNTSFKKDVPLAQGGTGDYDNYITLSGYPGLNYYNRGGSPADPRQIVVGSLDTQTTSVGTMARATYSVAGPGVDVWAAGTSIMSAACNNPAPGSAQAEAGSTSYFLNPAFKEMVLSGTSEAAPQITGICAQYLQINPRATPQEVKNWLLNSAVTSQIIDPGSPTSYMNVRSLLGGPNRVAFQPIQGLTYVRSSTGWSLVKNTYVRAQSNWQDVNQIYAQTAYNLEPWQPVFKDS